MREESNWLDPPPVGEGWMPIVLRLDAELRKLYPDYKIEQIKEKFGGLRYYVSGVGSPGGALIDQAERECYRTCEWCGAPGELRNDQYWLLTLCGACNAERNEAARGA